MKSPPFCAIINLLDYDSTERGFFMSRKNPAKNINIGLLAHVECVNMINTVDKREVQVV